MRTIVYVDGFNLFHRLLKTNPQYKWLNLQKLSEEVLRKENKVIAVNYYTARVSARVSPTSPRDQQIYLDALATVPTITPYFGNFQVKKTNAHLCPLPPEVRPPFKPWPTVVRILKTEEKGSDVNLGSHLIRDGFQDKYDVAAVITNDTDLIEPIRIVTQELGKPVGLISPVEGAAKGLQDVASFKRHISQAHLSRAQFPNPISRLAGEADLFKPEDWV